MKNPAPLKILVAWPTRREGDRESQRDSLRWSWGDDNQNWLRFMMSTPQGADAARSDIITTALEWGADIILMLDDDYTPLLNFRQSLDIARQGFARGCVAIVSPSVSFSRTLLVWPEYGTTKDEHYELESLNGVPLAKLPSGFSYIGWAGLSWVYIDATKLGTAAEPRLKVLDRKLDINGKAEGAPMYCIQTPKIGEDRSLCDNLRDSTGLRIGCDTRLAGEHYKRKGQRSYPGFEEATRLIQRATDAAYRKE